MSSKHLYIRCVVLGVAMLLSLCLVNSCNQGNQSKSGTSDIRSTSDLSLSSIQSIDDQSGPYYGQYEAQDRWIAEHATRLTQGPSSDNNLLISKAPDEMYLFTAVSDEGWMLPSRVFLEFRAEARSMGSSEYCEDLRWLYAIGPYDEEIERKGMDTGWDVEAKYYQPVPAWLVAAPPERARLLPNGEVVTRGMLGSGDLMDGNENNAGCCWGSAVEYWRYNAEGNPVRSTSDPRYMLLFRDFDTNEWYEGATAIRKDGYFIYYDPNLIEDQYPEFNADLYADVPVLAVYDYDGTLLDFDRNPPRRSSYEYRELRPDALRKLYRAQLRIGKTK